MSRDQLVYAFGHLVSSHGTDASAAWSGELAYDVMDELGMSGAEQDRIARIAEHVAGNYVYTGEAEAFERRALAGEA